MSEEWITIFGNNSLVLTLGPVAVHPGLGRHQLAVPIEVRASNDVGLGAEYTFSARMDATGLRGGGGYLGVTPMRTTPRRLLPHGKITVELLVDLDPNQIRLIEERRDGAFGLNLFIEAFGEKDDGSSSNGATHSQNHPIPREAWLLILEQIGYRRTLLLEVDLPEPHTAPHLSTAINFFADAQRRFLEGQYRGAVEHLRQVLDALVGADPAGEDDDPAVKGALKAARAATATRSVDYVERFELVRKTLKFLTDLAAHPENGSETTATDARAAMVMTAALLQWYSRPTAVAS